jgi:hypothetical protein
MGAGAWPWHAVVDQRQQLRMGYLVRRIWQTSYKAQGIDSYGWKWAKFTDRIERPGIANGNCIYRIERFSTPGIDTIFPVCNAGRNDQRMGAAIEL